MNSRSNTLFAVVGAGPGGLATAAHISLLGFTVNLFNRTNERIEHIARRRGITVSGVVDGFAKLNKITTSPKEAIEDAKIVIIVTPAYAHKEIATIIAPHLKDGQLVILTPGRTGGAIEFDNVLRKSNVKAKITIAETQTILYTCRPGETSDTNILALKKKVSFSAFPAVKTSEVASHLTAIFPQYVAATDVLETGLNNIGCILHPTPTLLNIGWIETPRTCFKYYYEAITPSVARILELLDEERLSVARCLGTKATSTREWLNETYGASGQNLYEAIQHNKYYETIDAPETIQHRYILEDVPTGLVPISSLGAKFGVDTPLTDKITDMASLACSIDFRKVGRTVSSLGIDSYNVEQLKEYVKHSFVLNK